MRERLLGELVGSYLYRDILELEGVRRAEKIVDLLRMLAFQIGQEVSLNELASNLGLNRLTVERYLDLRNDVGQLWENYLMVERRRANEYSGRQANTYFWRTYDQKEIDYVEERAGQLFGYDFKWQGQVRAATRHAFIAAYPESQVETINRENFTDFVG